MRKITNLEAHNKNEGTTNKWKSTSTAQAQGAPNKVSIVVAINSAEYIIEQESGDNKEQLHRNLILRSFKTKMSRNPQTPVPWSIPWNT